MIPNSNITDLQRLTFMQKLVKEVRAENGLLLERWETGFLESFLLSHRPSLWFIGGRKAATDGLWRKYGNLIELPFPLVEAEPVKIADADPDGCEFYVREDGRLRRCNDPAAWQRRSGFRYCVAHAESVQRDLGRRGKKLELIKFP